IIGKAQEVYLGRSFFTTLKKYTVEGYCTSQAGATRGLSYLYVPGSFHSCIPLQPGQRSWATR
ncbi:MAG TPA: gluconate 2-dehydrogenase subunit 3 family protein, partial [Puia sp.]|nr:gluconate 2-dehydrogenase subunit 3 family protein [Puia sp.]